MVVYYQVDFFVKRNVRVSQNVSPNGGRETSGDDGVNFQTIEHKWDEPNFFQATVLLRSFVLFN